MTRTPQPPNDPQAVPSYVPAPFVTLVKWAAGVTRVPVSVVAAQWSVESSFNPAATSPTGAQGLTQIEPATWQSSNCSGNPDDPTANVRCYVVIMGKLLAQYRGNIRDALTAYNAGQNPDGTPNQAGAGYATLILNNAQAGTDPLAGGTTVGGAVNIAQGVPADCAWGKIPGVLGGLWPGACIITYKQAREAIGAGILVAGVLVMGWGAQLLVGVAALGVASKVVTPAVSKVSAAQATVRKVQGLRKPRKAPAPAPAPARSSQPPQAPPRTELINTPQGTRRVPEGDLSRKIREGRERTA